LARSWLDFFGLARFFSGLAWFFSDLSSVWFFGFRLIKPKLNRSVFQNFNWFNRFFFTVWFFCLFFFRFSQFNRFFGFFTHP
jgi:hypothetical protein